MNKKTTDGKVGILLRPALHAAVLFIAACVGFALDSGLARAESFMTSGVRSEDAGAYFKDNSFSTGRAGGEAFRTDPETGDRRFKTPAPPKSAEPEGIEILPVQPEIYPVVPAAKPPVLIQPGATWRERTEP